MFLHSSIIFTILLIGVSTLVQSAPNSKSSFDCTNRPNGVYPNVEDCSTFYKCSNGYDYLYDCPASLLFDKEDLQCDWPHLARCATDDCSRHRAGELAGVTGCHGNAYGDLYPDRYDCRSFYQCAHGPGGTIEGVHKQCPANLHFNNELKVCDYPERAGCKECGGGPTNPPPTTQPPTEAPTRPPPTEAPTRPPPTRPPPTEAPTRPPPTRPPPTEAPTRPPPTRPPPTRPPPTTQAPTEAPTTQRPTRPPPTQRPTRPPPTTQAPTEAPTTQRPTRPPPTQRPIRPPSTQRPTRPPPTTTQAPTETPTQPPTTSKPRPTFPTFPTLPPRPTFPTLPPRPTFPTFPPFPTLPPRPTRNPNLQVQ